jgi:predicted ATPase
MRASSLSVSNLLSFGEFHLDLDDGLTVLVGPNGAGKTNIVRVLDLVTKLVEWADERSRSGAALPSPADAMLSSCVEAMHDGSPPGTPMEVRLGVQFTTPAERARILAFVRAAILATLSDENQAGDEGRKARLSAWVTAVIGEEQLAPLFTGTLAFRHPGFDGGLWEARYEFEVEGSIYDWVLYTPSYWASIVAHGASIGPSTAETKLSEALFGLSANSSPPPPLPDPLPHFEFGALCPPADRRLTNLVVRLGTGAVNDQHEPFRTAASLLGFQVYAGAQQAFGLSRALRLNLNENLIVLGEQFRGLGVGGSIPWRAGVYPWELLAGPVPPRDPGFLPLRLFELKNGSTVRLRQAFTAIQKQFEQLAPGRAFDVTFTAAQMPVQTTAPIGAGQVGVVGGGNDTGDEGEPGSIITVIGWDKADDGTARHERPIQLLGAGTWETLVLAEALVRSAGRLTVLDEPGASLHPTWQSALRQVLRQVPGQVLLVTHSPHLVPMETGDDLNRIVRLSNQGGESCCHRLSRKLDAEESSKITREFALSTDARGLLFCRGAVIVSGQTEQGALPIWWTKSKEPNDFGGPEDRDIAFYSAPGDGGFRTILSVLDRFGIPWVILCDGKSFDTETNWSSQIFRQIEGAGVELSELKHFTERLGAGGKYQRRMTQELWTEQVTLGARHGVFTLATSWTGSGEALESFFERVAPGKLAEAETQVGGSKIRKGRWVAQETDCPSEVDDLYRQVVAALNRVPKGDSIPSESPS